MSSQQSLSFDDGDIILRVGDEELRVHRTKVAPYLSKLIEGVVSNGQIPNAKADELPVVTILEEPTIFKLLLQVIYGNDLAPHFEKLKRGTLKTITNMFALVTKLNITSLDIDDKVRPILWRDWPETLLEWDTNEEEIDKLIAERGIQDPTKSDYKSLDSILPEPAALLNYVRSQPKAYNPLPIFVSTALYHLSRLPPIADPEDQAMDPEWTETNGRTATTALLAKRDYKSLLIGIDSLRTFTTDIALVEFKQQAEAASVPQAEKDIMMRWWWNIGVPTLVGSERRDPVHDLLELINALESSHQADLGGTSEAYRKKLSKWVKKRRLELWNALPQYFNGWQFFEE